MSGTSAVIIALGLIGVGRVLWGARQKRRGRNVDYGAIMKWWYGLMATVVVLMLIRLFATV
jgi:hypothetical protein